MLHELINSYVLEFSSRAVVNREFLSDSCLKMYSLLFAEDKYLNSTSEGLHTKSWILCAANDANQLVRLIGATGRLTKTVDYLLDEVVDD